MFFHEIPHEVGDFSYLLKQNVSLTKAYMGQIISAAGAFFGVYLSFFIGEIYSDQIIAFASGTFLYVAVNTIMGDLKNNGIFQIIFESVALILGVLIMYILI